MNRRGFVGVLLAAPVATVAEAETHERLHLKLNECGAIERLRAQILYATRGRSRPTEFELPSDEYEAVLSEVLSLGPRPYPAGTADATRRGVHNLMVYGVRVIRGA